MGIVIKLDNMEHPLHREGEIVRKRRASILNRELVIAAQTGELCEVRELIKRGSDVNFVDEDGDTVLHYAVRGGNLQVVKEILKNIQDVFVDNNNNETALTFAKQSGDEDIMKLLQNKVLWDSLNFLEKQFPITITPCNNPRSNFINKTMSGNFTIPLDLEDMNTILKVKQIKGSKAILETDLEENLKSNRGNEETIVLIIKLETSHWALLVIGSNVAFYADSVKKSREDIINTIKTYLRIPLNLLKWQQNAHEFNSCIYVLKNIEIVKENLNETTKELQEELSKTIINCIEERQLLANILNEIKRTNDKMEFCLRTLQTLNSREEDISVFTYRNANALILFLETFALEDTHPHISEKNPHKDDILRTLRKLKKTYYTGFYFQPTKTEIEKPDYRLICDVRNKILHSNSKNINLADFTSFMAEDMRNAEDGVIQFFKCLEMYTNIIYNKIHKKDTGIGNMNCNLFLAPLEGNQEKRCSDSLDRIYLPFLRKAYELGDIQELIFDLTVNVIPALDNEKEEIWELNKLRNIQIHNFQQYKDINEKSNDFKNIICSIRSKLFKYYYSSEFHKILENIKNCPGDEFEISTEFTQKLKDIENQFQLSTTDNIASTEDVEGSFEYKFSKSYFLEKDDNIKELVEQYLKFMVITYNEEYESGENQLEQSDFIIPRHKKFTPLEKREIFESFVNLKNTGKFSPELLANKKIEVFELVKKFGIRTDLFDEIIALYVDADEMLQHVQEDTIHKITDTLHSLKKIKSDNAFLNKKVILLYERFVKGLKFQDENQSLQEQFNNLPSVEIIQLRIGEVVIKVNTFDVITDMLQVVYSSYNKYQIEFSNIEEAFIDTTFLDYLIDKDVCKIDEGYIFRDPSYIFMVIKKLLNREFAAPYIAGLLIKAENDRVIESKDLCALIGTLLSNDLFISHLDKLLHIESHKVNLYEVVCSKMKNVESIHAILKDPKHAQKILEELLKETKHQRTRFIKDVLKLLNEISYGFYKMGNYDKALKLIENEAVQNAYESFNGQNEYIIDTKYQIALIKMDKGRQIMDKIMYKEARNIFKEITETLETQCENPKYLLSWIKLSDINNMLEHCDVQFASMVYERVRRYALGIPFNGDIKDISNNLMKEYYGIISSKRYNDVRKYFDILSIRSDIAYQKCMVANKFKQKKKYQEDLQEYNEALEMYKEIYSIQKKYCPKHVNRTMENIAYVHSRIAMTEKYKYKKYHQHEALIKLVQTIKSQKETQTSYKEKLQTKGVFLDNLKSIAYYSKDNTSVKLFYRALKIYNSIDRVLDNAEEKLKIKYSIAETLYNLGNATKRISNFKNSLQVYKKIYKSLKIIPGGYHKYTKHVMSKIKQVKSSMATMNNTL